MLEGLLIPLVAVGLAELGDKTQLSVILLSSKTSKRLHLLLGVILAFFLVDGLSVLVGSWITNIVSVNLLKIVSGIVFIIFGGFMLWEGFKLRGGVEGEFKRYFNNPFFSGFMLIFLTEWGDKTQIAAAIFATQYNAVLVLSGTMIALTSLSIAAIYLGKVISRKIDRKLMAKISGIAFILIGISLFFL